jgi:hypothetical protein
MVDLSRLRSQGRRLSRQPGWLVPLPLAGLAAAASVLLAGPGSAAAEECPSSNPPNVLTVAAGSPQTAQLGKAFQTNLQVALANSNGCPLTGQLAGFPVAFSAPASDASGTFASSGTSRVTVGTDATGLATAPIFTANDTAGSYSVHADSGYGSVRLYLTNTASGVAATIAATGGRRQSAPVSSRYRQPLQAQVMDANGLPVQGVSIRFSLGSDATSASAGASFLGGESQASTLTDAHGRASSPPLVANKTAGRFTASATVNATTEPSSGTSGIPKPASYALRNVAGAPATISAGGASGQSTPVGSRFPIRLAVTVTDANANHVAGALVTFTAPAHGPSGRFSFRPRTRGQTADRRTSRIVRVKTNHNGVAIAPAFTANRKPGGYIVTAAVGGRRTAFALVNRSRR